MNTKQTVNSGFASLLAKVESLKKSGNFDLSMEEDLSVAVMNLVSLEEHFFFTGEKTGKPEYFDLLDEARRLRQELLAKMIDQHEGETWCIAKHLLAATMRLIEVGAKLRGQNKKEEAKEMFDRAYKTYALFWGLRLKLLDVSGIKKIADDKQPWTVPDIVNKLVNCCDEK